MYENKCLEVYGERERKRERERERRRERERERERERYILLHNRTDI